MEATNVALTMQERMERTKPYNLFFNTIPENPTTSVDANCITFTDLLCPSLGDLKSSLQINMDINIDWLLTQYSMRGLEKKPLTIVLDERRKSYSDFEQKVQQYPNIKHFAVTIRLGRDCFTCHHSKIGVYAYEDGSIRIVVSTANLLTGDQDWNQFNQGLWVSPKLNKLPQNSTKKDGESPTHFKFDFLNYLESYNAPDALSEWIEYVTCADFSEIRVAFICSIPGYHPANSRMCHLSRVEALLREHCVFKEDDNPAQWTIIAQVSSIASLKSTSIRETGLLDCLKRRLGSHQNDGRKNSEQTKMSIVYPSENNLEDCQFKLPDGGYCLAYYESTTELEGSQKNYLLNNGYMYQWQANGKGRTRIMPHIKTYCRVSPDNTKLAYFLLTSANLSRSAWGTKIVNEGDLIEIRSCEAGVMFLPKFFGQEYFEINHPFPVMFDLPLSPYAVDDKIYIRARSIDLAKSKENLCQIIFRKYKRKQI